MMSPPIDSCSAENDLLLGRLLDEFAERTARGEPLLSSDLALKLHNLGQVLKRQDVPARLARFVDERRDRKT